MIRLVQKSDIDELASIYKELYDNADIGENWTIERAKELLLYWYDKQPDLFFVDIEDDIPVGAIVSGVKSWFDGPRLIDTEIFVSNKCQKKHIGKNLMLEHLKAAKIKYNACMIEFHTYGEESEFPQNWYNRIGFEKDEELIIMHANIEEVLQKLGYSPNMENNEYENVYPFENYSYQDLSNLYSKLIVGDKAYIFDMLPVYSYLNNEAEKEYIESRITAMKNGAEIHLFMVGSKKRLAELKKNSLFQYAIHTYSNNSKIYIIEEEEMKKYCLNEYFQLAQGLYYGERNGSKEAFRDLWINSDNIGIMIREVSILKHIEESIQSILEKISSNEMKVDILSSEEV